MNTKKVTNLERALQDAKRKKNAISSSIKSIDSKIEDLKNQRELLLKKIEKIDFFTKKQGQVLGGLK